MTDLHGLFREWLISGAPGEPGRDVALHASACDACGRDVAALDALLAVDVAAGDVPFLPAGAPRPTVTRPVAALRALSGAAAVGLLVAAAMIGAGALREPEDSRLSLGAKPTQSPDREGILGGGPSLAPSTDRVQQSPSPTASPEESADATREPDASAVGADARATPPPFIAPPPPPATPAPTSPATPRPTAVVIPTATPAPTAPSTAAPTPTVAATPAPTPTPTPTASPSQEPPADDCEDGIDNDSDLLVDALDPGCALDGNEASAP